LFENGLIVDALVSQNSEHERELWAIREDLPVNLMQLSRKPKENGSQYIKVYKYDVSLALSDTDAAVLKIKNEMNRQVQFEKIFPPGARFEFCCFGHAGDQNLHLNVLLHLQDSEIDIYSNIVDLELLKSKVQIMLDRVVFETVISFNGSVSAEHGVGQQKRKIMSTVRSSSELLLMSGIKKILDPNGILNPGKVIPDGF
jgi:FAD/FMN-containing dehydrogenase